MSTKVSFQMGKNKKRKIKRVKQQKWCNQKGKIESVSIKKVHDIKGNNNMGKNKRSAE